MVTFPLPVRSRSRLLVVALVLLLNGYGCRCNDPPSSSVTDATSNDDASSPIVTSSRDADPPPPPVCEGPALSLTAAVMDPRCAIEEAEWASLAGAPTLARAIRPTAKREGGESFSFALVNQSPASVDLPLRFQSTRPPLSVVAEDQEHTLFDLAPPTVIIDAAPDAGSPIKEDPSRARAERQDAILGDAGGRSAVTRVYSARVRLPSKGTVAVRAMLQTKIEKRIAPPCKSSADAAACTPPPSLPKGHYTLHIGHFFLDLGPDQLARLEIDL